MFLARARRVVVRARIDDGLALTLAGGGRGRGDVVAPLVRVRVSLRAARVVPGKYARK